MCYSAIPDQCGHIRAIRDVTVRQMHESKAVPKAPPIRPRMFIRPETILIASGQREPISQDRIPYLECRRQRRSDNERGKRQRKATHKPQWRSYEKF